MKNIKIIRDKRNLFSTENNIMLAFNTNDQHKQNSIKHALRNVINVISVD